MKKILVLALFALVSSQVFAHEKQNLRVLYVGGSANLGGGRGSSAAETERTAESARQRTAAFEAYLNEYFTHVGVVQGKDYTENMSARYDVTIFDGAITPISGSGRDAQYLSEDFANPAMMLADTSPLLGVPIGLKFDHYCLCLWDHALNFDLNHQIFAGPFPVRITVEHQPTPDAASIYVTYFPNRNVPDTMPMWRVQHFLRLEGQQGSGNRIGLVSRWLGFTDSPDSEFISSGTCEKSPLAVAIGRHGNYFHWGFSASPPFMTDEARQVFANAVVYTSTLKGERVIARKYHDRVATKEYVDEMLYFATRDHYNVEIARAAAVADSNEAILKVALEKQARGEPLVGRERSIIGYRRPPVQTYEDFLRRALGDKFERWGNDMEGYSRFYTDNLPYLYAGSLIFYDFIVDEDVKSLGIPNNDIRLLDKAISMLERNEDVAKARRILDRYTLCTFETAKEWRDWFEANKSRIFFTESGGWYFMVNTLDPNEPGNNYRAKAARRAE